MIRAVGAVALAGLLALAAAGPAEARPLTTGFADAVYFDSSHEVRAQWLDRTVAAGAGIVRLSVAWSGVARGAPPANPSDPADPAYDFGLLDQVVGEASERGLDVVLTVADAPAWAEGPDRPSATTARRSGSSAERVGRNPAYREPSSSSRKRLRSTPPP